MRSLLFLAAVLCFGNFSANAQFVQMYNGQFNESATCVTVDADNNTIVGIYFQNTVNADPFGTVQLDAYGDETDMGLIKYNEQGQVIWAKRVGGEFTGEKPYAVETDNQRNVYVVGHFGNAIAGGTVAGNFDPDNILDTVGTIGREDGFLARYDSSGAFDWVVRFGNLEINTNERTFDLAVDAAGNAYVCGAFQGMMDFNPYAEPNVQFSPDSTVSTYVAKYDTSGFCIWVLVINSACNDVDECFCSLDLSPDGNIVVGGNFRGMNVNVDPQNFGMPILVSNGETDVFVAKYNTTNGAAQWVRQFGSTETESLLPTSLRVDASDNIYFTGSLSGTNTVDMATGAMPHLVVNSSLFLTKLSIDGIIQWAKGFNSSVGDNGKTIAFDNDQNVYLGGSMNDTIFFGNGITRVANSTTADAFLAKFNSSGDCQWAFNFGGDNTPNTTGNSWVNALAMDQQENFLVVGELFGEMADIDPVNEMFLTSSGAGDGYIFKFTKLGAFWPDTSDLSVEPNSVIPFDKSNVAVFPIPFSSEINFQSTLSSTKPFHIDVFDVSGRKRFSTLIDSDLKKVDTQDFEPGSYFITIRNNQFIEARRLIVKM